MSSDTDTRVVAAEANGVPASASAGNPIIYPTSVYDTHGAYNSSTGRYTVPVSGYYDISSYINVSSATNTVAIYKNGVQYQTIGITGNNLSNSVSGSVQCDAGDLIDIRPIDISTGTFNANKSFISISRRSGPAVVAASETVNAIYSTANTTVSAGNSNVTVVPFTSKTKDTHNAYNTSTGAYTVPVSGTYYVAVNLYTVPSATSTWVISVFQNGNQESYSNFVLNSQSNQAQTFALLNCKAGDTIDVRGSLNSGSASCTFGISSTFRDQLTISRVGN